jgi:ubiquinone/menaquinone biosynthesis C-methylase UbiE
MVYHTLEHPSVYNVSQKILAPGSERFLKEHFAKIFKNSHGHILDVGCGPKLNTPSQGTIFGLDINEDYIHAYSIHHRGIVGSSTELPFKDNAFDEVRTFGLLHHLDDKQAVATVNEMVRCTKPKGRVIIIDNVWPKNALVRPVAWLNRRLDRGKWVRSEQELRDVVGRAVSFPWMTFRFTYTYVGHEALALTFVKK